MNTKGSMGLLKGAALAFIVVTIIMVVGADITLDLRDESACVDSQGRSGQGFAVYNASNGQCTNSTFGANGTNVSHDVFGYAWNTSTEGLDGVQDLSDNLTTIATVVGAVILLSFLGVRLFNER